MDGHVQQIFSTETIKEDVSSVAVYSTYLITYLIVTSNLKKQVLVPGSGNEINRILSVTKKQHSLVPELTISNSRPGP